MFLQTLITWTVTLTTVYSSSSKTMKMLPTVSRSVFNLGKLDVSFNFYGKDSDSINKNNIPKLSTLDPYKSEIMVGSTCPCSDVQFSNTFLPRPSEIISKILGSDSIFKEPISTFCCNPHEQSNKDVTIMVTYINKFKNNKKPSITPFSPLHLETPPNPKLVPQLKPKSLEIFLFPKRKDMINLDFTKTIQNKIIPKEHIRVVGDKILHNEIKDNFDAAISIAKDFKDNKTDKIDEKDIASNITSKNDI